MYLGLGVTDLAKHVHTRVYAHSRHTPRGAEFEKVAEVEAALLKVQEDAARAKPEEDDAARSQNGLETEEGMLSADNASDAAEARAACERIGNGSAPRMAFGSALPRTAHSESGSDAAFGSAGSDQASSCYAPAALQTIACDKQVCARLDRMAVR